MILKSRFWLPGTLLALLLTGCGNDTPQPESEAPPFAGLAVQVAVPSGWRLAETWEVQLQEWSARTGADAKCVEYELSDSPQPLWKAASAPQLVILPWTRLGAVLAAEPLSRFPESSLTETQLDARDLFRGVRDKLGKTHEGPTIFPLSTPTLVCYYRADLLQAAGRQPPQTWGEYQTLLDELDQWAPGLTAVEPWGPEFRASLFFARSLAFAQHRGHYSLFFDVETGVPLIDSPGFVRGWETLFRAQAKLAPECLKFDPAQCRDEVVLGRAALALGWEAPPVWKRIPLGDAVPQPDDLRQEKLDRPANVALGFVPLPGSAEVYNLTTQEWQPPDEAPINTGTLVGFAGFCAVMPQNRDPALVDASAHLLASLTLDEGASSPAGIIGLCRERQLDQTTLWVGRELSAGEAGKYVATMARELRDTSLVLELPVLGRKELRSALTQALTQQLENPQPAGEALRKVHSEWQRMVGEIGPEVFLNGYRRALGLQPKSAANAAASAPAE